MSRRIVKKIADTHIGGFMQFVREQGVVGLATGFLLGGAVSKVVTALVTDIINPMISIVFGSAEGFKLAAIQVGDSKIMWGDFVSVLIDFLIVAAVVYFGFKGLGLEKLDKKKEKPEEKPKDSVKK
ncbi:MAG: MscL family protein [Candidatus Moranbacteria bacterium]|nr:MscL family protein [Candidatus Moranbacteria bacterium]